MARASSKTPARPGRKPSPTVTKLRAELTSARDELSRLHGEHSETRTKLADVSNEAERLRLEVKRLSKKRAERGTVPLQNKLAKVEAERDTLKVDNHEYMVQVDQLEDQVNDLSSSRDAWKRRAEDKAKAITDLKAELAVMFEQRAYRDGYMQRIFDQEFDRDRRDQRPTPEARTMPGSVPWNQFERTDTQPFAERYERGRRTEPPMWFER